MSSYLPFSRRRFLQGGVAALAAPVVIPSSALGADGATAPSERVTMGFIGCGRQCYHKNIPLFLRTQGVQALAVCDVDTWRLVETGAVNTVEVQTFDGGVDVFLKSVAATYPSLT